MDRRLPFGGPACALRDWTNANLRLRRLGWLWCEVLRGRHPGMSMGIETRCVGRGLSSFFSNDPCAVLCSYWFLPHMLRHRA